MSRATGWVAVGRIGRAHGIKGEVSVLPLSEVDSRFEPGSLLFAGEAQDRPLTVASARPHRARLIVAFEEISDRSQAEAVTGQYLFIPASSAPDLPAGTYWAYQIVGCEVLTEDGRSLGRVREVLHSPANDLWTVQGEAGDVLLPALSDVVREVDLTERRIVVRDVPGLTGS